MASSTTVRASGWVGSMLPTRVSGNIPWVCFVTFYCIICNIPYWIAAHEFGFSPLGWFCAQYAAVGLVALFAPRFVTLIWLLVLTAADLISGACMTYHVPVRECLENIRVALESSVAHPLRSLSVLLSILLIAAIVISLPSKGLPKDQRRLAAACLVAFVVVVVGGEALSISRETGHFPIPFQTRPVRDQLGSGSSSALDLARVPIVRLSRLWKMDEKLVALEEKGRTGRFPVPSATAVALGAAGITSGESNRQLPNVVLVLVESWGLAEDSTLRNAMVKFYSQPELLARYQVLQGAVPFYGATIAGEARELCGNSIGYYLMRAPASDLKSCLPQKLSSLGYEPIAVHGFSGHMYVRSAWYPTIGFQEQWFHEQLHEQGLSDCNGLFVGTCDADVAAWIGRRLDGDSSHPKFIHWMTLNSHLPVPVPVSLPNAEPCSAAEGLEPDSQLCSWYQLVMNVHRSVAQLALDPLGRPTVFVIVGDHAPPFGDPSLRERFSQSDVPYVVLVPRSAHNPPKSLSAHNEENPASGQRLPRRQLP
jgi:Sulfatase